MAEDAPAEDDAPELAETTAIEHRSSPASVPVDEQKKTTSEASERLLREIALLKRDIANEYRRRETYDRETKLLLQTKMLQLGNLHVVAWERETAEKK